MYLLGCLSIVFHELASFVADIALRYLNLVNEYQQYPAARCAMGDNVVMYQLYKGAARKKRAYDGGDGAVAVTKEDVVDVVRKTYKGLQGRRGQMMEEMVQLLLGGQTEQSRCVLVNYVLSTNQ